MIDRTQSILSQSVLGMQYLSAIDSVDHQNVSAGGVRGTARQQHERRVLFQLLEIRSSCSSRWSEGVSGRLCTVRTPLQLTMTMPACLYAAHTAVLCARSHGSGRRSKHRISAIVRAHRRTGDARAPSSMCARTPDAPRSGRWHRTHSPSSPRASKQRCRCCCSRRSRRQGRAC